MYVRFRPATPRADDVLDTAHIRALWHPIEARYLAALQEISGLAFRRHAAVVHCGRLPVSKAGKIDQEAMWLATRFQAEDARPLRRSDDALLASLTHELCHRLLSEHGVLLAAAAHQPVYVDHKILYVYLYDSWVAAFGTKRARALARSESAIRTSAYQRAWKWAMRLPIRQRTRLAAQLARRYGGTHIHAAQTALEPEHLQPVGEQLGPPPAAELQPHPVTTEQAEMPQMQLEAQPYEPVDPAQVEVAQPENQQQLIQNLDSMLHTGEDGETMSNLLAENLGRMHDISTGEDYRFPTLMLKRGVNLQEHPTRGMSTEEYNQLARQQDGTIEYVDDPAQPNIMLTGLLEATGAQKMRDDIAEGNEKGSIFYKGMLDGKPVYFEEYVAPTTVIENGETKQKFERSVMVLSEQAAQFAMDEVSDNEEKALAQMGIESPSPDDPNYVKPSRSEMREVLAQRAATTETEATANEDMPSQPAATTGEQELRESLQGVKESTELDRGMQAKMAERARPEQVAESKAVLDQHGISADLIDPAAAPDAKRLSALSEEDWKTIQESADPLIALWSRSGRRSIEQRQARLIELAKVDTSKELQKDLGPQEPEKQLAEEALRRSLPLIHGTSFEALMAATEEGKFSSNRAIHEKGVDVAGKAGTTHLEDREVGLDNYVFADYARPNKAREAQAEVTVVLEPEAMQQEGTFVTDHDLLDPEVYRKDGGPSHRAYMSTAFTGEDFAHVVSRRIRSKTSEHRAAGGWDRQQSLSEFAAGAESDLDPQTGETHFSTFEVKLPNETSTGYVRKLIFKNPEQAAAFQEKYGDQVPWEITVEPDLNKHLEALGTQERYEQEYQQVVEGDYNERLAAIQATPPDQLTESYVILDTSDNLPKGVDPGMVRPEWFRTGVDFSSAEEALAKAKEGHMNVRRRQYGPGKLQIYSPTVEIARVVSNGGVSVITEHQPHNLGPERRRASA